VTYSIIYIEQGRAGQGISAPPANGAQPNSDSKQQQQTATANSHNKSTSQ